LDILLTADFSQQNFFEEVCFNVIAADRKIKFAGIVDADGKLFFGKHRPDATNKERSFVVEPGSFYNRYLIPAIHKSEKTPKKRKNTQINDVSHNYNLDHLRFGLINFCEGTRKLIVIPLDEEGETKRYLCIYILK
jgi:hypothetical protein